MLWTLRYIVTLSVGTNLDGVWSTFRISSSGISSSTIADNISCRNVAFTSSQVALAIAGLDVVTILRVKFILWYRDCNQPLVITKFKYWPYLPRSLLMRIQKLSWQTVIACNYWTLNEIDTWNTHTAKIVSYQDFCPFISCKGEVFSWPLRSIQTGS